jgi:hypothetical protein
MGLGSWIQDLRSGIRKNLFRIPDPEVKKAPDWIRNTGYYIKRLVLMPAMVRIS